MSVFYQYKPKLEILCFDEAGEAVGKLMLVDDKLLMIGETDACKKARTILTELFCSKVEVAQ